MWTFKPIYISKIWGGSRLPLLKNEPVEVTGIGESFELSPMAGYESVVSGGKDNGKTLSQLIDEYGSELLGERNVMKFGARFPLLVKLIDAHDDLSVQVHPDDEMAKKYGLDSGKSEMWYVLSADSGAKLANGFKRTITPDEYEEMVRNDKILDALNYNVVKEGDVFYIPAGRVHALGSGTMVIEIQQACNTTYRIYDYNRRDDKGNLRRLDTELAFEAIDFSDNDGSALQYDLQLGLPVNLVTSPHFTTNVWNIDSKLIRNYGEWDTFVVIVATKGEAKISCGDETVDLRTGMTVLIPASAKNVEIDPVGEFSALETYIK